LKLLSLHAADAPHPAVLIGEDVLDLVLARAEISLAHCVPQTMRQLIESGPEGLHILARVAALASGSAVQSRLRAAGAWMQFSDARLAPVVPDPNVMLSGSMNSRGHLLEMGDELPMTPCAFHKVPSAIAASGADILPPPDHGHMLDWEGEFCAVIGARCHRVTPEQAEAYILGYTLTNDISAREYVRPFVTSTGAARSAQAWENNVLGKNFPGFSPIGPVIATKDEFPSPLSYHLETVVNGERMQSSTEADLVFTPPQMVAYFSQFYIFQPGDIISMGSPPGVGMARKPPMFLKPGDVVEVHCKQIGALVNRIAPG
jgi:acylpyruvate hydrolase